MNETQPIQITVIYDNNPFDKKLKEDWGLSCFIKGLEKSILFDTGAKGSILLSNMKELGLHPEDIDLVFLSHEHRDHTGGLEALLEENPNIEVLLPQFFSSSFKDVVQKKGASFMEISGFQKICESLYTTGVVEGWIKEQSLIIETKKGLVVLTGCAHPRVIKIITKAKELLKKNIFTVLGGFHFAAFNESEIKDIISQFRALEVKKVGPCHCSGNEARRLFALEYKDNFIKLGVGAEVRIP